MTPAQSPVVSTLIYNLQTNGDNAAAAAIAIYMIVILVLLGVAARRLSGMGEDGAAALAQPRPRAWRRLIGSRSRFAAPDTNIEAAAAKPRG